MFFVIHFLAKLCKFRLLSALTQALVFPLPCSFTFIFYFCLSSYLSHFYHHLNILPFSITEKIKNVLASLNALRAYFIFHGGKSYCLNCSSLRAGNALDLQHILISRWNARERCVLIVSLSLHPANIPLMQREIGASIPFMKVVGPAVIAWPCQWLA